MRVDGQGEVAGRLHFGSKLVGYEYSYLLPCVTFVQQVSARPSRSALPGAPPSVATAPVLSSTPIMTVCNDSAIDSDVVLLSSCSSCMARGELEHPQSDVLVNGVACFASISQRVR